jgi:spore maturation protein CgeB
VPPWSAPTCRRFGQSGAKAPHSKEALCTKGMTKPVDIVIFGLSITSSWGNGHATTFRALVRALSARGHNVCFLERDMPWYAEHRDMPNPPYGLTQLYKSLGELKRRFTRKVMNADLCIVGSYVPDGVAIGEWVIRTCRGVKAFYDIDTPVTLAKLASGETEYLNARLVRRYDLYLSFTGGPVLRRIERELESPMARALYCSVDPKIYFSEEIEPKWDLGYMGTYSPDRQPSLNELLIEPARRSRRLRSVVVGPMYPRELSWPANVERIEHLAPSAHRRFYNSQRFTLNLTRADMRAAGYSPSVRIFEAAACGTPIVSDYWPGLETFFELDKELLTASSAHQVLQYLEDIDDDERRAIGERARVRVLASHTSEQRAIELEGYVAEVMQTATATPLNTEHAGAIA